MENLGIFLISGAGFYDQHARHGCTGASSCHFMCLSVCEESAFLLSSFALLLPSRDSYAAYFQNSDLDKDVFFLGAISF